MLSPPASCKRNLRGMSPKKVKEGSEPSISLQTMLAIVLEDALSLVILAPTSPHPSTHELNSSSSSPASSPEQVAADAPTEDHVSTETTPYRMARCGNQLLDPYRSTCPPRRRLVAGRRRVHLRGRARHRRYRNPIGCNLSRLLVHLVAPSNPHSRVRPLDPPSYSCAEQKIF